MPNFGEQPTSPNREKISGNEENTEDIKKQISEAISSEDADKIIELGGQMKALKGQKKEFINEDEKESYAENAEKMKRGELKEKGSGETMYEEAQAEDGVREKVKLAKEAEEEAKRKMDAAEQIRIKAEEDAAKLVAVRAKINGDKVEALPDEKNGSVSFENTKTTGKESTQKKIEDIYGMNKEALTKLMESRGYLAEGEIKVNDPKFKEKMEELDARKKTYGQERVKLFDRVLSGTATEEEMEIAEEHAATLAKTFGLRGFHSAVPKSWYTNERLVNAMSAASGNDSKEWIKYVKESYTDEQLKKGGFEKIDKDGFMRTYNVKGF